MTTAIDPLHSDRYSVAVNGEPVPVYGSKSCKFPFPFKVMEAGHPGVKLARPDSTHGPCQIAEAGNAPYWFAPLVVEEGKSIEVTVSGEQNLEGARVRPAQAAEVIRSTAEELVLRISKPGTISIEINEEDRSEEPDNGRHGGLLLFADLPETEIPKADDPTVHFYGPGLHRVDVIHLRDNETLYLAPGAIVEGGVRINGAKNVKVIGRGILCGDPWGWRDGPQKDLMLFDDGENIHIEGITIRCSWQWTFRMTGCRNLTIRNIKIVGGKNLNDDGIDPSSCQNVLIDGCFIRTHDDNISIKAHCDDRR
ncbi:MAG: glycosyl hydrolase family 28 protein, partial [Planctomycetota bacterium]